MTELQERIIRQILEDEEALQKALAFIQKEELNELHRANG